MDALRLQLADYSNGICTHNYSKWLIMDEVFVVCNEFIDPGSASLVFSEVITSDYLQVLYLIVFVLKCCTDRLARFPTNSSFKKIQSFFLVFFFSLSDITATRSTSRYLLNQKEWENKKNRNSEECERTQKKQKKDRKIKERKKNVK